MSPRVAFLVKQFFKANLFLTLLLPILAGCSRQINSSSPIPAIFPSSGTAAVAARVTSSFAIQPTSPDKLKTLYAFKGSPDGNRPVGLLYADGDIYGTTYYGGTSATDGTVFKVTPSGDERVLYNFTGGADGGQPEGPIIDVGGVFYSTTSIGGSSNDGTVFKVTKSGTENVLYSFKGRTDGAYPAGIIAVNGKLYGAALGGGTGCGGSGCGVIFAVDMSGIEHVIYTFKGGTDGDSPNGGLIYVNGELYGTTFYGGAACNCGTVFAITTSGNEHVVYSFKGGNDGSYPAFLASLLNVDGTLYGTTSQGGGEAGCTSGGCGTVFEVTQSGAESVLYRFKGLEGGGDGSGPYAGLLNVNGILYGETSYGGSASNPLCSNNDGCGTVYKVTISGKETVINRFTNGAAGYGPSVGLIKANGMIAGVTLAGPTSSCCGAVFEESP